MRVTAHTQPVASRTESVCGWTVFLCTDVQRQQMYADVKLRQSFTLDGLYTSIWYGMSPIRVRFIGNVRGPPVPAGTDVELPDGTSTLLAPDASIVWTCYSKISVQSVITSSCSKGLIQKVQKTVEV